jgi:hypothetical protein
LCSKGVARVARMTRGWWCRLNECKKEEADENDAEH